MKKAINIGLIFLAIHLFTVHSKLLYHINPDKPEDGIFSFINFSDEATIISLIVSVTYSIITVMLIKALKNWKFYIYSIAFFGFLDGVGVTLYYMIPDNFTVWGSLYYGTYTLSIILGFGISEKLKKKYLLNNNGLEAQIMTLNEMGLKNQDIAEKTNISLKSINQILTNGSNKK